MNSNANIVVLMVLAIILITSAAEATTQPASSGIPDIWREINSEAANFAELRRTVKDEEAMRLALMSVVKQVATRTNRSTIETLVSTPEYCMVDDMAVILTANIIASVADPQDEYGLKSAVAAPGTLWVDTDFNKGIGWHGIAVVAMDLYRDHAAREMLLKMAHMKNYNRYAWGFLRTYEPVTFALAKENETVPTEYRLSLEFSSQINDPAKRERYYDFERRLWRSYVLTPWRRVVGSTIANRTEGGMSDKDWQDGDETYVLRIFETPNASDIEAMQVLPLCHRLSVDGQQRLKVVSESKSAKAHMAQEALTRMAQVQKRQNENNILDANVINSCYPKHSSTTSQPAKPPMPQAALPDIWLGIIQEAKILGKDGVFNDYKARQIVAERMANKCTRSDIETIIRTFNDILAYDDRDRWIVIDLSARILACVADPKNAYGLRSTKVGLHSGIQWHGIAAAALDTYHDDAACAMLLEMVQKGLASNAICPSMDLMYPLGFLRTYAGKQVVEKAEEAFKSPGTDPQRTQNAGEYLTALRESMRYSMQLKSNIERASYFDFERRVWRAWALTFYSHIDSILDKQWKEEDEAFILRLFEDDQTPSHETGFVQYVGCRLSDNGRARLKVVAEGQRQKSEAARKILGVIEVTETNKKTKAKRVEDILHMLEICRQNRASGISPVFPTSQSKQ